MTFQGKHQDTPRSFSPIGLSLFAASLLACALDQRPQPSVPPLPVAGGEAPSVAQAVQADGGALVPGALDATTGTTTNVGATVTPTMPAGKTNADDVDAGPVDMPGSGATSDCSASAQRVLAIAQTNCAACHGPRSPGHGGFATVLNLGALVSSGKVVPGKPDTSPLFVKVSSGAMPPDGRTPRPSAADIETIRGWISCGAPDYQPPACTTDCTTFVDIDTRLSLMLNDLKAITETDQRLDVRYIDLTNFANAGHGDQQLDLYRDGISYLMNSLSRAPLIAVPQAVDGQALLFRIKLSDYGWTAASWEQLVADYPYGVTYDVNSRTFPVQNEPLLVQVRQQTGTVTPYIQADWFFSHAARPPLYYDLLGVPTDLRQLQVLLQVDLDNDVANQKVVRAGFSDSGPSYYNRVIERHALSNDRGMFWRTFDFDSGTGFSNITLHPLDFQPTSSEMMFSLANGLQGYMIVDARGARLDKAPNASVRDPQASDLAIEAGLSCINCHAQTGVTVKHDSVGKNASLTTGDLDSANAILALYKDDATLDALFADDRTRYQTAATAAHVHTFTEGSAHTLDNGYGNLLSSKDVAGVLGISEQQLLAQINAAPNVFSAELSTLRKPNAKIARDVFDAQVAQLVTALGLGTAQP